jgi:threonine dehydrogenase-like Zn-dependent dehydrogenase
MKAAVMRRGELVVDDIAEPRPAAGQILVRTLACGICGSDLHALAHGDLMVEMVYETPMVPDDGMPTPHIMDLTRDVVMGHEFAAEVLEVGDNVGNCAVGDVVVSMPVAFDVGGLHAVGYSNDYPGGYGELMVLNDLLALKVPNGLSARRAALTEPMAVGLHAVNKSQVTPAHAAVVLGTGPVGLAVIAALRAMGVETIIAADFSPTRRALALTMGAHDVVDPGTEHALDAWRRLGTKGPLVIFEAVGVPGMIDDAIRTAPRNSQILVVGVCMQPDTVRPFIAISKELNIQFALAYDPMEFAESLRRIADGELDVDPLITGSVGIDGVPQAFADLADPDAHAKILVEPGP